MILLISAKMRILSLRLILCLPLLTGIVFCGMKSPPLPPLKPALKEHQSVPDQKKQNKKEGEKNKS